MLERTERRAIALLVTQEGEERIDIFGLGVGPDRRIGPFPAGTVHQAAFGVVNTFGSTDFRKGEHGVDHRIGSFQHQVALPFSDQCTAFGIFGVSA